MKRFDIELFVKSTLQEYTLTPKKGVWLQLLDQLQKQEQKRDQRIIFMKAVLFIIVYLAGFASVTNKSIQHLDIPLVDNSNITLPTADIEVEKGDTVSLGGRKNSSAGKNEQAVVQEQIPKRDVLSAEVRDTALVEVLTANKRSPEDLSLSPKIQVTDAEIEYLMRKARQNIEKKRALLKQQEILPAQGLMVDAIDIEEETESNVNSTDLAFNNFLREVLKIKTAFAN